MNTQYNQDDASWSSQEKIYPHQQQAPFYAPRDAGDYPYVQAPYQGYRPYQGYPPLVAAQNSSSGTTALVLGILSIIFAGPIGLILGIVGLVTANKTQQFPIPNGTVTAGRICSIIGIAFSALTVAILVVYIFVIFLTFISVAIRL